VYKVGTSAALLIAGATIVFVTMLNGAIILVNETLRRHHHRRHRHRATHLDFTVGPVSAKQ